MKIEAVERAVAAAERSLERDIGQARALAQRAKEAASEATDLEDRALALEEAIGVMNSFADAKQKEVQNKIEALVTHGLRSVFGDEGMSFAIVQELKSRRLETRFVIRTEHGGETLETSIMDARGGGVAAVAGFLLRLIVTLLKPGVSHFLLLDETFAQLSAGYEPAMAEFMAQLVEKTDIQLVLITHSTAYEDVADRVYRFSLGKDGRTVVEAVK